MCNLSQQFTWIKGNTTTTTMADTHCPATAPEVAASRAFDENISAIRKDVTVPRKRRSERNQLSVQPSPVEVMNGGGASGAVVVEPHFTVLSR